MGKKFAAWFGCVLMLSSSGSFAAAGSASGASSPAAAPAASSDSTSGGATSSTNAPPAAGPATDLIFNETGSTTFFNGDLTTPKHIAPKFNGGCTVNSTSFVITCTPTFEQIGTGANFGTETNAHAAPASTSIVGTTSGSVPPLPPPEASYTANITVPEAPSVPSGTPLSGSPAINSSLIGSLPDLSGPAYSVLTRDDQTAIGHMIVKEIRDANLLIEDPEITDYLQTLGMKLASQAHDEGQSFAYHCMRGELNAFATFGGNVFVFTDLILATKNEAELASVMAHETGHVVQRHMERELAASTRLSIASIAGMLAAIAIGAASHGGGSGGGVEGAMALGQAISMQQQINFVRTQEIEADYVGIQLLAGAGYDPYEMASFFESLQQAYGMEENEIPALLQDHPVTTERIASARARAGEFPRPKSLPQSQSYDFIKERVRVVAAPPDGRIGQYYASIEKRRTLTPAERYGQALVQIQSGEAAAAVPTLRALQQRYPDLVLLYSALGQALEAAGRQSEALNLFANAVQLFPRNVPLTLHYAETLMHVGQPQQAHQLLLDLFNNVEPTPAQIWLTAQAANAANDAGDAYYYMCEYNLENGNLALANQELELALATPQLTNVQRERFRARLLQVREWMREQQSRRGG
jgi:beta-barrel assembly-enhancing protease